MHDAIHYLTGVWTLPQNSRYNPQDMHEPTWRPRRRRSPGWPLVAAAASLAPSVNLLLQRHCSKNFELSGLFPSLPQGRMRCMRREPELPGRQLAPSYSSEPLTYDLKKEARCPRSLIAADAAAAPHPYT